MSAPPTRSANSTGWTNEQLLELAAEETRVMITFDAKDFTVIARRSAEAGKTHAGLGIVVGIDHGEFRLDSRRFDALSRSIDARPAQAGWSNLTLFSTRPSALDTG